MNLSATYKIDISQELHPTPLQQMFICQDKDANRLNFELYNGEAPYSPGGSCAGYVVRSDGETVPMTGTVSGNLLSIVLPEEAYAVEGPINVAVKSVAGGSRSTIFFGMGTVLVGQTGTIVNPGDVIPDITELMAAIDQMEQATAAANAAATKAVRFDTAQSLTGAQKAQARQNIQAAQVTAVDFSGSDSGLYIEY